MKTTVAIICVLSASVWGCVSTQRSAFVHATPGCKSGRVVINQKEINTSFCIKQLMFKPSQYLVTVNGQPVFEGTDFTKVAFEKKTQDGLVRGSCDEIIQILDNNTLKPVKTNQLPAELVSGCNIKTDPTGISLPFKKDVKCDEVFYDSLAPLLGTKVAPVQTANQCSVTLDNHQVFEEEFKSD